MPLRQSLDRVISGAPEQVSGATSQRVETLVPGIYRAPNGGYRQTRFTELGARMRLKLEGKHTGS